MKWLTHAGGPLPSRMEAEIKERRRRLAASHPEVAAVGVSVEERWEEPAKGRRRHLYRIDVSFTFRGKGVVVEGRPETRGTLAVAQVFRAARRKIEELQTGRPPMTTRRRLKAEKTSAAPKGRRERGRLSAGTVAFRPPIFIIGR